MKFEVPLTPFLLDKLLIWANSKYDYVAYFTDNAISYPHSGFINQLFAGNQKIKLNEKEFGQVEVVGILSYDYKNQLEKLQSCNKEIIKHPDELFFLPDVKILISDKSLIIVHPQANIYFDEIIKTSVSSYSHKIGDIRALTSKEEYLKNVKKIQEHIIEGDVYEMNYCIAFHSEIDEIDPIVLFDQLMKASPMPFSVYFKAKEQILICASPERFLKKENSTIIAQPIKGTIKRGSTTKEDEVYKTILHNSEKERSENLMIVDLMRNDLSKISITGSVKVEELFGIYSFMHVHQMISTVSSTLAGNYTFEQIIQSTFPMGSMTGAPKIKCMELIDRYENFKRGWFSGTVGYIDSKGDFDFNVIIRSLFLDMKSKKLLLAVGSAITYDADPEQEYDECLLKAKSIFQILKKGK
ncbi:MAG TPA: anthranilate synthase component I family protein [Anditalea sp.]|nr:anthranilate synthase component I family protein [Anditalea sp.]